MSAFHECSCGVSILYIASFGKEFENFFLIHSYINYVNFKLFLLNI